MKEKLVAFYNSKWFVPVVAIILWALATAGIYALFEHFHLWFALFLIVALIIFVQIVVFFIKSILNLFR